LIVTTVKAVLLDVDGTLVNSNDAHAHAWVRAFAEHGIDVPFDAVRRAIGMGGDHLMPRVSHLTEESPEGQQIAERRGEIFKKDYLPKVRALRDAEQLVAELKARGFTAVAASSAKRTELEPLLKTAGASHLMDATTSNDDAESSKPEPDIIQAALKRAGVAADEAVMIGDTPYDIEAARRAGVRTIAFRSGGWSDEELRGAVAIYDGPWDLLQQLDQSPLRSS
jgi:HAD superfamily hydrolase (TIGR01509 family)